jgi:endoglucanase
MLMTLRKRELMKNRTSSRAWLVGGLIAATIAPIASSQPVSAQSAGAAPPALASVASATSTNRPIPVHILAGYSDNKTIGGTNWLAGDKFFPDGQTIERPDISIATNTNTGPAVVYQAERYSMSKFTYAPVPNGDYTIKLHFCETFDGITEKGQRVFGYAVKGAGPAVKDFDVFATAGGALKPVVKTVPITVTNQTIEVEFTSQVENPQINAIEIFSGR